MVGAEHRSAGHHAVQFYGHDDELAERVAGYLLEALGGGVAIVIATPEHRRDFEDRLTQAGADLAAAGTSGAYLALDASETVRELMPAGHVDAFAAVCRLHQEIVGLSPAGTSGSGGPGAVRTFAFSRHAPAAARHFTVGTLNDWGAGDFADDAALVVTELAANAIVHAGSAFTVLLSARGDLVRISVRDARPLPGGPGPALAPAPLHGLGAVDALASRWGVESLGDAGKTVWVELRR